MNDIDEKLDDRLSHIADIAQSQSFQVGSENFLYVESEENHLYLALFDILQDRAVWINADSTLTDAILDEWDRTEAGKKWAGFVLLIKDGKFEVEFFYAENLNSEESSEDRRQAEFDRRYGQLPIDYSSAE